MARMNCNDKNIPALRSLTVRKVPCGAWSFCGALEISKLLLIAIHAEQAYASALFASRDT